MTSGSARIYRDCPQESALHYSNKSMISHLSSFQLPGDPYYYYVPLMNLSCQEEEGHVIGARNSAEHGFERGPNTFVTELS